MKKILTMVLVVLMVFGLVACDNSSSTSTDGGEDTSPIVIGCLQDITGPTSSLGTMVYEGAKWAAEEINNAGGINGREVEIKIYDTTGSVDEAITAFTKAVTEDQVSAIIGPPVTNIALAIAPISENYDVPVLGFAGDLATTVKEDGSTYKNMFLFQCDLHTDGAIMANYSVSEAGYKTAAILYNEANAYSVALKESFEKKVNDLGGTITGIEAYNNDNKDFNTLLAKLMADDPEVILVPNYTQELIMITQEAQKLGYEGKLFSALDACPPFNSLVGLEDLSSILYINNINDTDPELVSLIESIREKTGVDATNKFFLGYDVTNILADIVAEVGDNPVDIRDAVEAVEGYEGYTGVLTIDPATHAVSDLDMAVFTYEGTSPKFLGRFAAN